MIERITMPLLTLMLALSMDTPAQEVISRESGTESAGGGVIIEIGGDENNGGTGQKGAGAAVAPEEPVNITRNPGATGIEMIVGGQSQDGVAKRSNLPVVE